LHTCFVCSWLDFGQDDGFIERQLDVVHYVPTPPPSPAAVPQEPVQDEPGYFSYCQAAFEAAHDILSSKV